MQRFTLRTLTAALTLLLALIAQPQPTKANPVGLTPEEFLQNPAHYGRNDELGCLALAVYQEAEKGPQASVEEKLAIAWVIRNRLEIGFRPGKLPAAKSICEVVWVDSPQGPQFSWVRDNDALTIASEPDFRAAFAAAQAVAIGTPEALQLREKIGAVDLFHADYANPDWAKAKGVIRTAKLGAHFFYIEEARHAEGREAMEADLAWQVAMLTGSAP